MWDVAPGLLVLKMFTSGLPLAPSEEMSFIELPTFSSRPLGARAGLGRPMERQNSVCNQDQGSFVLKVRHQSKVRTGKRVGALSRKGQGWLLACGRVRALSRLGYDLLASRGHSFPVCSSEVHGFGQSPASFDLWVSL